MPYKFSTKKFTLSQKHPLSKERFELGNDLLITENEKDPLPSHLSEVWEAQKSKKSFLRI